MERRTLEVPPLHAGETVTRLLHDGLGLAHATAKGLIDAGCVTVNGRPVTGHAHRCDGGDVIELRFDPSRQYRPEPEPRHGRGFRVIHEDREIVVVNKQPGILTSPAPGEGEESLAEAIAASLKKRGIRRPQLFVVHRLDRHTSGLLVLAKSTRALESLTAQFESRQAGREYIAVVEGSPTRDAGTIQSWLVEDPKSLSVRTTPLRGAGKRALTHFRVIERFEGAALVQVRLDTGRKHQIRVHFAEIGHPVLGDRRYGMASPLVSRVALHAHRLRIRHPATLETVTFEAPLPEDLTRLIDALRRGKGTLAARSGADAAWAPPRGLILSDPTALWEPFEQPGGQKMQPHRPSPGRDGSWRGRDGRGTRASTGGGLAARPDDTRRAARGWSQELASPRGPHMEGRAPAVERGGVGRPERGGRRKDAGAGVGDGPRGFRPEPGGRGRPARGAWRGGDGGDDAPARGGGRGGFETPGFRGQGAGGARGFARRDDRSDRRRDDGAGGKPPRAGGRGGFETPGFRGQGAEGARGFARRDDRTDRRRDDGAGGREAEESRRLDRLVRERSVGRKPPRTVSHRAIVPPPEPENDPRPRRGAEGARKSSRGARAEQTGPREPWNFPQKGMTRRRERRQKIKAAQTKGKKP